MARAITDDGGVSGDKDSIGNNNMKFYNSNRFTVEVEISMDECIVFLPYETKTIKSEQRVKVMAHTGLQEVK